MGGHRAQSLIRGVGEYNIMHNTKANNKIADRGWYDAVWESKSVTKCDIKAFSENLKTLKRSKDAPDVLVLHIRFQLLANL